MHSNLTLMRATTPEDVMRHWSARVVESAIVAWAMTPWDVDLRDRARVVGASYATV